MKKNKKIATNKAKTTQQKTLPLKNILLCCVLAVSGLTGCEETGDFRLSGHSKPQDDNLEARSKSTYSVNAIDLNLTLSTGIEGKDDVASWNKIVHILPNDDLSKYIAEYHVFSDGVDNTLAYVSETKNDASKWIFAVDYMDATDPEYFYDFDATIIHEYFHILSLNAEQMEGYYLNCPAYTVRGACSKQNSYINQFYQAFWTTQDFKNHHIAIENMEGTAKQHAVANFYSANRSAFINQYASTNPVEDIAETFAYFVLSDKITNPVTIRQQKINFFYQYPELVKARQHIRGRTGLRR